MKGSKNWSTDSDSGLKESRWQVVCSPKARVDQKRVILKWDYAWTVRQLQKWMDENDHLDLVVHDVNGAAAVTIPHFLNDKVRGPKQVFVFKDSLGLSREERFEISTFFGEQSLGKLNPDASLRGLYNFWSYQVLSNTDGLTKRQADLLDDEQGCRPVLEFPAEHRNWVDSIRNLICKGEAKAVTFPFRYKSGRSVGVFLKKFARKYLRIRVDNPQDVEDLDDEYQFQAVKNGDPRSWRHVLITGWYGTETAGDKAILGEIVHQLRGYNSDLKITISSIDLRVSWQTRIEMSLDVRFIPIRQMFKLLDEPSLDAVVMGGGPLMESSQILPIARLFHGAAKRGINRVIYGCGVGPIHTEGMSRYIAHIIRCSNVAFYRDQESLDYAIRLGGNPRNSILACDPAIAFVCRWRASASQVESSAKISTMFREQTAEYQADADVSRQNRALPEKIASVLNGLSGKDGHLKELNLIPMHVYWRGNDDRGLNLRIAQAVGEDLEVAPFLRYQCIYGLLNSLNESKVSVAMRYHGHVFSIALNIPFVSMDYTGKKGKVSNLMQRIKWCDFSINIEQFEPDLFRLHLEKLISSHALDEPLKLRAKELHESLNKAYEYFWY